MSWNRLVTSDSIWLRSVCPCAGVVVAVELVEPAAALPVVVAALVEVAGVLTGTIEGAGKVELAGLVIEVGTGAGLETLACGLLGTVAGVAPAEPVAAPLAAGAAIVLLLSLSWSWPFPLVRNWSTILEMSWNKLAKKVKIWLSSFCPCCWSAEAVELVAVLPEVAASAGVGVASGALLEVVAGAGLVAAIGAAMTVGGAGVVEETAETLLEAAADWLGPFEPAGWAASCS